MTYAKGAFLDALFFGRNSIGKLPLLHIFASNQPQYGGQTPKGQSNIIRSRRQTNSAHDRHSLHLCNWGCCACGAVSRSYLAVPFVLVGAVPLVVFFLWADARTARYRYERYGGTGVSATSIIYIALYSINDFAAIFLHASILLS